MYAKSGSFFFMVRSWEVTSVTTVGMISSSTRSTPISFAYRRPDSIGARPYALSAKMNATRGLRLVSFHVSFT